MKRPIATILLALAAATSVAHADVSAAARAFSDGQTAQLEGNYERAAQSFELAYNIAPSKEALRSAVRARQQSGQLPRAATLAQLLLAQYPEDTASAKLATDVIAEARLKLGKITVTCSPQCTLAVGGRATSMNAAPTQVAFTTPGRQVLEVTFDGDRNVSREITIRAGDEVTLPIEPPPAKRVTKTEPPPPPPPVHRGPHGLPPYVALSAGAVTLVVGSVALWSGLDTNKAHDAYAASPTEKGWSDGRSKQLRTNILLGTTAATGLFTIAVAVFWTRWSSAKTAPEVAIASEPGGMTFSFGHSF